MSLILNYEGKITQAQNFGPGQCCIKQIGFEILILEKALC
jgi:hypothetical protein